MTELTGRRPDNRALCGLVKNPWRYQAALAIDRRAIFCTANHEMDEGGLRRRRCTGYQVMYEEAER
jgi:hypothetical protein